MRNLLNLALGAIGSQTVQYIAFIGNVTNDVGVKTPQYAEPVNIRGSFQPIPKDMYERNGLDFTQHWFSLYASKDILEVERDVSSDRIEFNGNVYQVKNKIDWLDYNGWVGVSCVRL